MDLKNTTYLEIDKYISENQNKLKHFTSSSGYRYVYDEDLDSTIRIIGDNSFTVYIDRIDKVNNYDYYPCRFINCIKYSKDGLINKQNLLV